MTGYFLAVCLLIAGFTQKWYFPQGINYGAGRILIGDTDRDGNSEFIFSTYGGSYTIYFYELHLPTTWEIDSAFNLNQPILWDMGDFDGDGLFDLAMQCANLNPLWTGISIFESPDSFSYPTQEVWRDTVGLGGVIPIVVFDADRDGIPEIFNNNGGGQPNWVWVYEANGNNQYDTVCTFSPMTDTFRQDPNSTYAFGDFDEDGKIEFVMGDLSAGVLGAEFWVFESPTNNTYEQIFLNYLPTKNIKDCFTVPDADGDGKLEFVVKGFIVPPTSLIHCFIFEATGNNTYQVIKSFTFSGGYDWYGGGYSDVGDIDGDSIPEICLEGCQNIFIIKSSGNDSFYLWQTLPGNNTGSSVQVFDIDGNGLNEIIISGNNYTRICEKTPFVTWFYPEPYDTFYANDTVYPRWRLDETISLDSLRLYWAHPQLGCHLIYQGLPTDTICQWVVPDTQSNMSNRFWLVTKGFGRYDSTYSPVFYIKRRTGIEERILHSAFRIPHLDVFPNPFRNATGIKFQIPNLQNERLAVSGKRSAVSLKIYDATGRLVRQWDYESATHHGGIRLSDQILWDGTDDLGHKLPPGIYFVYLRNGSLSAIKKVIKLGG